MKTKVILLLIFVPVIAFGQKQENFNKLIDKLNHCLLEYDKLTAFGSSDNYYPINGFGLSKQEIKELIVDVLIVLKHLYNFSSLMKINS